MLDSNVLKAIFENAYFDLKDTYTVNAVLCQLEDEGYDVSKIRARIEKIKEELRPKELSLYNDIVFCKSNELLEKYLSQHEINRDNFSSYIRSRKFLDKKLKESILLKLCQYYKTDYISVYDLLSLVQISQETDRPLKDVLAENCIDGRRLKNIMNTLKEQQPDIYLILDKSIHGCNSIASKLIRIYNSIMKSNITDYDTFVNKYKNTPEGILELFDGNELYDSLYESLLKWYNFKGDEVEQPQSKKNK